MSIRSRLLLLALLATLLPTLLVVARFFQERDQAIAADTNRLSALAEDKAHEIADRIQGTAQLHYGLARAQDLDTQDRATCSAFLSDVRDAYPQYTGILTIRPDGSLFCDSLQTGRNLDLRDRAYFQAAIAATDEVVLQPAFGRLTGIAVIQVAYPVRSSDGELLFVLLASLNLESIVRPGNQAVQGSTLVVLDHEGTVLAVTDVNAAPALPGESIAGTDLFEFMTTGGERTAEIAGQDGGLEVWAMADPATLDHAQLHIVASVPEGTLVAPANIRFGQNLLVLAGLALGIFIAVLLTAEFGIRRPVTRISDMADRLAAGDLSARIAPPLPHGELGALMATLNQAAGSLEQQRADIAHLNERLRQSQRMESIGQLTGGIAHDFNNLLTVVMGNAELLAADQTMDLEQRDLARTIGRAAEGGAELTQRLLAFGRRQALDPRVVDINGLVANLDPLLRRTIGEHVEIELVRAAGLWPALIDQSQLENALLNLCVNARDAMPDGGRLTLETANVRLDAEYAAVHADVAPGPYVMLAVSDTGSGIPPEDLERVFEPFFTTKGKGKGSGLGLSMVYGFVMQSSGHIAIYSEPGQGTTVKLYLPRAGADQVGSGQPATDAPASMDAITGGTDTILMVEDDEAVRRYGSIQLRAFGYTVLEAADGPAALAILAVREDVDLLFTDVVMPGGMTGQVLADRARGLRPGLRILYTSGYTENALTHQGRLDGGALLLRKPYRRAELDRAIRTALDKTTPDPDQA